MSRQRRLYDGTPVMPAKPLVIGVALSIPLWAMIISALRWVT